MKVGLIADEFTRVILELEPDVSLVNLTPMDWWFKFQIHSIDFLLVESAWLGYKEAWKGKIAKYNTQQQSQSLNKLLAYCKKKGIPTVFWNKEDPLNYERFQHNLDGFDVCLTTEKDLVGQYKKQFPNLKHVGVQSFFFQPEIHNPKKDEVVNGLDDQVLFCGGLYQQEFPERASRLIAGINSVGKENVVIFDRFDKRGNGWNEYSDFDIRKPFSYKDSKKYYQSGVAHFNANSLDGSETMFSRRLIELLACGSKVLDLTHMSGKSVLSPYVYQVSSSHDIKQALEAPALTIDYDHLLEDYSSTSFIKKLHQFL